MTREEIGKYIKYLRIKNNYTQDQLAERTGYSRTKIRRIENGGQYAISGLLDVLEVFKETLYIAPKEGYANHIISEAAIRLEQKIILNLKETTNNHQMYGWVYIAKLKNDNNIIKLGFTKKNKAEYRIQIIHEYFQPGIDPEMSQVELYYSRLTSDCRKVEKKIHEIFGINHMKGEWFKVNCKLAKDELDRVINDLDTPHLKKYK